MIEPYGLEASNAVPGQTAKSKNKPKGAAMLTIKLDAAASGNKASVHAFLFRSLLRRLGGFFRDAFAATPLGLMLAAIKSRP